MSRICTLVLAFLAALTINSRGDEKSGRAATVPLKVLFLGDRGHHSPADRAAQLIPVLAGRGINVTYTERLGDLNRDYLDHFDAVVIYANIDRDRA